MMQSMSLQLVFLILIKQRVQVQCSWQVLTLKHAWAMSEGAVANWSQNHAIDYSSLGVWMIIWQSSGPFPVQITGVDIDMGKSWECQGTRCHRVHTKAYFFAKTVSHRFGTVEHQVHRFKECLFKWNPLSIGSTRILKFFILKGKKNVKNLTLLRQEK